MYELTCRNHRGARYLSKNPHQRGLHFVQPDPEWSAGKPFAEWECPCPFEDLLVVSVEEWDGNAWHTVSLDDTPVGDFRFRSYN